MIREVRRDEIPACVELIKKSFMTVANEYGIVEEGALDENRNKTDHYRRL